MQRNSLSFAGFAGSDATLFTTNTGLKIVSFRLAETEKGKNGYPDRTTWMEFKVLGGAWTDYALENVKKGCNVDVEGKVQTSKYKDKQGNERDKVEVLVRSMGVIARLDKAPYETAAPDLSFFEEVPF